MIESYYCSFSGHSFFQELVNRTRLGTMRSIRGQLSDCWVESNGMQETVGQCCGRHVVVVACLHSVHKGPGILAGCLLPLHPLYVTCCHYYWCRIATVSTHVQTWLLTHTLYLDSYWLVLYIRSSLDPYTLGVDRDFCWWVVHWWYVNTRLDFRYCGACFDIIVALLYEIHCALYYICISSLCRCVC